MESKNENFKEKQEDQKKTSDKLEILQNKSVGEIQTYLIRKISRFPPLELNSQKFQILKEFINKLKHPFLQNFSVDMIGENTMETRLDYDPKNLESLCSQYLLEEKEWEENDLLFFLKKGLELMVHFENNFCCYPEISQRSFKLYITEANNFKVRLLNPFLQTKFLQDYFTRIQDLFLNGPSGVRNNIFLFDCESRKNFLELKQKDQEYEKFLKVNEVIEKNSKNLVYQLFFTVLCAGLKCSESEFQTTETEFYNKIKEGIKKLNLSEPVQKFFQFILLRENIQTLPTCFDLWDQIQKSANAQTSSFFKRIYDTEMINFQVDMQKYFKKKRNFSSQSLQNCDKRKVQNQLKNQTSMEKLDFKEVQAKQGKKKLTSSQENQFIKNLQNYYLNKKEEYKSQIDKEKSQEELRKKNEERDNMEILDDDKNNQIEKLSLIREKQKKEMKVDQQQKSNQKINNFQLTHQETQNDFKKKREIKIKELSFQTGMKIKNKKSNNPNNQKEQNQQDYIEVYQFLKDNQVNSNLQKNLKLIFKQDMSIQELLEENSRQFILDNIQKFQKIMNKNVFLEKSPLKKNGNEYSQSSLCVNEQSEEFVNRNFSSFAPSIKDTFQQSEIVDINNSKPDNHDNQANEYEFIHDKIQQLSQKIAQCRKSLQMSGLFQGLDNQKLESKIKYIESEYKKPQTKVEITENKLVKNLNKELEKIDPNPQVSQNPPYQKQKQSYSQQQVRNLNQEQSNQSMKQNKEEKKNVAQKQQDVQQQIDIQQTQLLSKINIVEESQIQKQKNQNEVIQKLNIQSYKQRLKDNNLVKNDAKENQNLNQQSRQSVQLIRKQIKQSQPSYRLIQGNQSVQRNQQLTFRNLDTKESNPEFMKNSSNYYLVRRVPEEEKKDQFQTPTKKQIFTIDKENKPLVNRNQRVVKRYRNASVQAFGSQRKQYLSPIKPRDISIQGTDQKSHHNEETMNHFITEIEKQEKKKLLTSRLSNNFLNIYESIQSFQNIQISEFSRPRLQYSELVDKLLPKKNQMFLKSSKLDFSFYPKEKSKTSIHQSILKRSQSMHKSKYFSQMYDSLVQNQPFNLNTENQDVIGKKVRREYY